MAEFAANCIHICDLLPRGRAGASNFKDQLARSATSAAANYAEATVPSSRRDFVGRLTIALKELAESRMHLSVISRLRYHRKITNNLMASLVDEADAIALILNGAFNSTASKATAKHPKSSKPKITIAQVIKASDVEPRKRPGRKKPASGKKPPAKSAKVAKPPAKKPKAVTKKKPPLKGKPKAVAKKKPLLKKKPKKPAAKKRQLPKRTRPKTMRVALRKTSPQESPNLPLPAFTQRRLLPPPPRQHLLPFAATRLLAWSP